MSTLLRTSSRQASRLALSSLRASSRSGLRGTRIPRIAPAPSSSAYLLPRPRFYSTDPTPPKEPKSEASEDAKKEVKQDGKKEEAKEDSQVKASQQEEPATPKPEEMENAEPPKLSEGWVWLSEEELNALEKMRTLVPSKQQPTWDKIMQNLKDGGAPQELQDLLRKQTTAGLSIGDTMKAVKMVHKLASRLAEKDVKDMFSSGEPRLGSQEDLDKSKASSNKSQEEGDRQGSQKGQEKFNEDDPKDQKGKQDKNDPNNVKILDASDLLGWILAAALFYPLWSMIFPSESREISWQELRRNYLDKGLVEKLVVMGRQVRVDLNQEATRSVYPDSVAANPGFHFYVSIGSVESFERHLDQAQDELDIPASERIPVTYAGESQIGNLIMAFGPTLIIVGLLYYASRRGPGGGGAGGGMFGFGKSKAKMYNHETAVKVKFSDVAGMDEAKVEIMEFVAFLKKPERFQRLGAKIPRGAILSGPPGTGKTLLAKATAGESGVPFFSVSGSEFVEMFVGVGASRVRDLFAQARKNAPCIVFIDEIDAIGRSRADGNKGFGGNEEREATLNQILTEMDGFNTQQQVVVLAGTNRPDVLDKALMRPGRFDRQIHIDRPTMKGRVDIFKVHLAKILTKEDMEHLAGRLSALTPGFSGADIANAVNEAALVGMFSLQLLRFPWPSLTLHSCKSKCRNR